jgi:hypothetical protein
MKLTSPKGYAKINAAPLTQTVPANKNQREKRKEMSAIQSFFVLFMTK